MKKMACLFSLFFCLAVSTLAGAGERAFVSVLRVIDGDTLRVWNSTEELSVRLIGVDTPEARANSKAARDAAEWRVTVAEITHAGQRAKDFTASFAPPGSEVELVIDGEDVYGRALAYVYLPGGRCLNEVLIRYGAALAPERYRNARQRDFAELKRAAREQKRGFWKTLWKNF